MPSSDLLSQLLATNTVPLHSQQRHTSLLELAHSDTASYHTTVLYHAGFCVSFQNLVTFAVWDWGFVEVD